MHSVEHIPNATDIVLSSLRDIISTSGTSALINTSDKPSIAMIKGTQMLYESKMEYECLQYEKFINMILNKYLNLDYQYKCIIWGGTFTWRDDVKVLKEMIQNGKVGFLPRLLSAYNTTMEEYATCCDYIDVLDIKVTLQDIENTQLPTKGQSTKQVGRPKQDDNDIQDDNTAASVEGGQNVSDNK
jgi:hypothetical protein